MGLLGNGWRIEVFGTEIKTKSPDQMVEDEAKQFAQNVVSLGAAVVSGDTERLKASLGNLVLEGNPTTIGVKKLAEELIPQIPPDKLAEVVGSGVIAFVLTGNPVLTVIAAAQEFYAEYELATRQQTAGPPMNDPTPFGERSQKSYKVECSKLFSWKNPESGLELWAGFHDAPVFINPEGAEFVWPEVDIREDDLVEITAKTDHFPNRSPEDGKTLTSAKGKFKYPSSDSPGLGANQITQTLVFEPTE